MEININRQPQPYMIYQRLFITNQPRQFFNIKIEQGFGYLLRRVLVKYPETAQAQDTGGTVVKPVLPVYAEFFDNAEFKARQPAPIIFSVMSGHGSANIAQTYNQNIPNYATVLSHFAAGVIDTPQIIQFNYGQPKASSTLNWFYRNNDVIQIHVTGSSVPTTVAVNPIACDIVLQGYYLIDKSLDYWR